MRIVLCDYCGQPAELVTGAAIYPQRPELHQKLLWRCAPCDAYVSCFEGPGAAPHGPLANRKLRVAKQAAHLAFDPLWREGGMTKKAAKVWLANALGIRRRDCEIARFDVATCNRVIAVCQRRRREAA